MSLYKRKVATGTDPASATTPQPSNPPISLFTSSTPAPPPHLPAQAPPQAQAQTSAISQRLQVFHQLSSPQAQDAYISDLSLTHFHIKQPHPIQLQCITDLINNFNVFLRLPTSGGKSLIYHLFAQLSQQCVLVVTPLVSLADDQVSILTKFGLKAVSMTKLSDLEAYNQLPQLHYQYIFVTPERLFNTTVNPAHSTKAILQQMHFNKQLSLFVIDEAHCICQWGSDFRTEYGELGWLTQAFPTIPILAITATATKESSDAIQQSLNLPSNRTKVYLQPIDRPNITYLTQIKPTSDHYQQLLSFYRTLFANKHRETVCFGRLWDPKYICPVLLHQYHYLQQFSHWFSTKVSKYVQKYRLPFIFDPKKYHFPADIDEGEFETYSLSPITAKTAHSLGLSVDLTGGDDAGTTTTTPPHHRRHDGNQGDREGGEDEENDELKEEQYMDFHFVCSTYPEYAKPFTSSIDYDKFKQTQPTKSDTSKTKSNPHQPQSSPNTPPFCPMCVSTSGSHLIYCITIKNVQKLFETFSTEEFTIYDTKVLRKYAPSLRDKCSLTYGHCMGIDSDEKREFQLYARLPFRSLPHDFTRTGIRSHYQSLHRSTQGVQDDNDVKNKAVLPQSSTSIISSSSSIISSASSSSVIPLPSPNPLKSTISSTSVDSTKPQRQSTMMSKLMQDESDDDAGLMHRRGRSNITRPPQQPAMKRLPQFQPQQRQPHHQPTTTPQPTRSSPRPVVLKHNHTNTSSSLSAPPKRPLSHLANDSDDDIDDAAFLHRLTSKTKKQRTSFTSNPATINASNRSVRSPFAPHQLSHRSNVYHQCDDGDEESDDDDDGVLLPTMSSTTPNNNFHHSTTPDDDDDGVLLPTISSTTNTTHNATTPSSFLSPNDYNTDCSYDMMPPQLEIDNIDDIDNRNKNHHDNPPHTNSFHINDFNDDGDNDLPLPPPPPLPNFSHSFASPHAFHNQTNSSHSNTPFAPSHLTATTTTTPPPITIPPGIITKDNMKSRYAILCPTQLYTEVDYLPVVSVYHGSLTPSQRTKVHEEFVQNEIDILIATIAFGMGINVPFINTVVHYGCPRSLNNYHQESGRGGRNPSQQALSVVFYSNGDFTTSKALIMSNRNVALMQHELKELGLITNLVKTVICKRRVLNSTYDIPSDVSDLGNDGDGTANGYDNDGYDGLQNNPRPAPKNSTASLFQFCFGTNVQTLPSTAAEINCGMCDVCLFAGDIAEQSYLQFKNDLCSKQPHSHSQPPQSNPSCIETAAAVIKYDHHDNNDNSNSNNQVKSDLNDDIAQQPSKHPSLPTILPVTLPHHDKTSIDATLRRWVLSQGVYFNESKPNQYITSPPSTTAEAQRVASLLPTLNITKPAIAMMKLMKMLSFVGASTLTTIISGGSMTKSDQHVKRAWTVHDYTSVISTTCASLFNKNFWAALIEWLTNHEYIEQHVQKMTNGGYGRTTSYITYKLTAKGDKFVTTFDSNYSTSFFYPIYSTAVSRSNSASSNSNDNGGNHESDRNDDDMAKNKQFTPFDDDDGQTQLINTPHTKVRITTLCPSFSSLRNTANLIGDLVTIKANWTTMQNTSEVKGTQLGMIFPHHPGFAQFRPKGQSIGSGFYFCLFEDIPVAPQFQLFAQLSTWDKYHEYFLRYNADVEQKLIQLRRAMGQLYPHQSKVASSHLAASSSSTSQSSSTTTTTTATSSLHRATTLQPPPVPKPSHSRLLPPPPPPPIPPRTKSGLQPPLPPTLPSSRSLQPPLPPPLPPRFNTTPTQQARGASGRQDMD